MVVTWWIAAFLSSGGSCYDIQKGEITSWLAQLSAIIRLIGPAILLLLGMGGRIWLQVASSTTQDRSSQRFYQYNGLVVIFLSYVILYLQDTITTGKRTWHWTYLCLFTLGICILHSKYILRGNKEVGNEDRIGKCRCWRFYLLSLELLYVPVSSVTPLSASHFTLMQPTLGTSFYNTLLYIVSIDPYTAQKKPLSTR